MQLYYENNKLLSEKQFNNHLQLYEGYINKANEINKKTEDQKIILRRNLQYALNGIILHELYFENIRVQENFNNINQNSEIIFKNSEEFIEWRDDFFNVAMQSRGWVIYAHELRTNKFINFSLSSHDEGLVCYMKPLIVLDIYEHAYYTDYDNNKQKYINQFIDNIDWIVVKKRMD